MTNQNLHHNGGWDERTETEIEAKWQKHVVIALWLLLALVITVAVVFLWTSSHGSVKPPLPPNDSILAY
jgi:hypothetical protein